MRKQMMKCRHGRTARYVIAGYAFRGCPQCNPPQVTATGRAVSPGRVTRTSLSVKRAHSQGALPLALACHPVALTPTTRNPGCATFTHRYAFKALELERDHGVMWFATGRGLEAAGRYELRGDHVYGYTDDPVYAMAWQSAARSNGIYVEILE